MIQPTIYTLKNQQRVMIREAEPRDAEQLLALIERVASESDNVTRGPGDLDISLEQERVILQEFATSPNHVYMVAEIAGEIVGGISFSGGKRPRIQHTGEFGVSVVKKCWGLGVGGSLLNAFIDWARKGKVVRKINLRVRTDNLSAIRLYEKYGFVHEGRVTREMFIRGKFVDCYLMGLEIDPSESER